MSRVKYAEPNNSKKKEKKERKPIKTGVKIGIGSGVALIAAVALFIGFYKDYSKLEAAEAYTISASDAGTYFAGVRGDGTEEAEAPAEETTESSTEDQEEKK